MKNNMNNIHFVLIILSSFLLNRTTSASNSSSYVPADNILLNCGASSRAPDDDGRFWDGDNYNGSKFAPAKENNTLASRASSQNSLSVSEVPYMTARIFPSEFTYSIPVIGSGRKFVRLHFYPSSYAGLNASNAIFSVTSGPFTLLKNFSAAQTAEALNFAFIVKEYSLNVDSGRRVNITFTPSPMYSYAYAFVNGIEVISMPADLEDGNVVMLGTNLTFCIDNTTYLEKVVRLNVGGNDISPVDDDTGLFRLWSDDSPYIFAAQSLGVAHPAEPNMTIKYAKGVPAYAAPLNVYSTARTIGRYADINLNYNLSWIFSVDPFFLYLVRLHFCEIESDITSVNQRVFEIFINNEAAERDADVIAWAGGNGAAVFKDYIVNVPLGVGDLKLELYPQKAAQASYYDAILNGLEIFKLRDTTGILAGPNPYIPNISTGNTLLKKTKKNKGITKSQAGIIAGGIVALCILCFIVFTVSRRRKRHTVNL